MKNTYLIINLVIIAVPFILTFLPQFRFYRKFKPLFLSILIVGGLFFLWDIAVTARGDWAFNDEYVSGFKIMGLPFEELFFFITVPYSCLFLYEAMSMYFLDRKISICRCVFMILALASFYASYILGGNQYTCLVLLVFGLLMAAGGAFLYQIFSSFLYWIWISIGMMLFFIFNYFLTALPVVIYNPEAITNLRVITIPIEDFFYNFSMLTLYLVFYQAFRREKT